MERYLTVNDVAGILNFDPRTIREYIKEGRIRAFKIGKGKKAVYRIAESELQRVIHIGFEENLQLLKDLILQGE